MRCIQLLANDSSPWDETKIAFQVVPKLNVTGRLADKANANNTVRYLLSDNGALLMNMAAQISDLNTLRKTMSEQMRQIHELDPAINTVEDLAKMPNYAEFYRFVKQNRLSLVEAYRLANMERLSERAAAATKQAAINAAQSKAHLEATKSRGKGGDMPVMPAEVREYYRAINPNATEAEIRADYASYLKKISKGV